MKGWSSLSGRKRRKLRGEKAEWVKDKKKNDKK